MLKGWMYRARKRIRRQIHDRARRARSILRVRARWATARARVWRYRAACDARLAEPPITIALINIEWRDREALYHGDVELLMDRDAKLFEVMDNHGVDIFGALTGSTRVPHAAPLSVNMRSPRSFRLRREAPDTQWAFPLRIAGDQDGRWWLDENEYPVRALAAFEKELPDGFTIAGLHIGSPC